GAMLPGGGQAAPMTNRPATPAAVAGVPAPPGIVPPPPGFRVPQPEAPPAPPPPDPRRDPFAAGQPQMPPQYGYYAPMPLPGTDDGSAAAPISKPKPWGRIGMAAGVAVVLFGVGNACGQVYESRVAHNKGIDAAVKIKEEYEGKA